MGRTQAKREPTAPEQLQDLNDEPAALARQADELPKCRKTFTLDAAVAAALEAMSGSQSSHVNRYVIEGLERDRMREAQRQYVEAYEAEHGIIDPNLVAEFDELLA